MAKRKLLLIQGERKLTRMLNALASSRAMAIHRSGLRKAAKVVLDYAKHILPVQSGAYRRSLTVRAAARRRKGPAFRVTQRDGAIRRSAETNRQKAFYGAFLELGYVATGRPRTRSDSLMALWKDSGGDAGTLREDVTTYRGTSFRIGQLRRARKIPGRWLLRRAGQFKEYEAIGIYVGAVRELIEAEARK